jgi:hypothetical protein
MAAHKFRVADVVQLAANRRTQFRGGACEIVRLMPIERGGEPEYHVKMVGEAHDRVVRESELE